MEVAKALSILLDLFADFSGLQINRAKSVFVGFGLSPAEEAQCSRTLGTPIGSLPLRYLGLPLAGERLKTNDWQPVIEKVERRLEGWQTRVLSRGGRLVLLKAVLAAIPTYYLSIFRMPAGVRKRLESLMRGFFWKGSCHGDSRGAALVSWEVVCRPTNLGGLGVRHLQRTNVALLTKWVGRVMRPEDELVIKVLRDRYGTQLDWERRGVTSSAASAFWHGLRPIFPLVQPRFLARLGDGSSFSFWRDNWVEVGPLKEAFPRLFAMARDKEATVKECWDGAWTPMLGGALSDQRVQDFLHLQMLLLHRRPSSGARDGWEWGGTALSAKGIYTQLCGREISEQQPYTGRCRLIWKRKIPLKVKIFCWLLLLGRLMTRSFRRRMFPEETAECPMCRREEETCQHLFFKCPFAQAIWGAQSITRVDASSDEYFWRSITSGVFRREEEWSRIFATLWALWLHRNDVVFRGRPISIEEVLNDVRGLSCNWNWGMCWTYEGP